MQLYHLCTSKMRTNTYIVTNGDRAFCVDPGANAQGIMDMLDDTHAKLEAILLTHGHFDHIGGVKKLLELSGARGWLPQVVIHKDDEELIDSIKNMASHVHTHVDPFVPDVLLKGGETLDVAGLKVKVIHTPGHTRGGVCFAVENKIFTGDTIFYMTYGRTDLYDASFAEIKNSIINKLFTLKGNYTLLPGHGDPTTMDFERKNNPILTDEGE